MRPIAVANVLRRLATNSVSQHYLSPVQLGVGVRRGWKTAIHAIRSVLDHPYISVYGMVLIELDIRNASNSVRRDHIHEVCARRDPSLALLYVSAYAKPSKWCYHVRDRHTARRSPGPVFLALSIDDIARSVTSPINVWCPEDATIGGSPSSVKYDLAHIISALSRIGLDIDLSKYEVINISCNIR